MAVIVKRNQYGSVHMVLIHQVIQHHYLPLTENDANSAAVCDTKMPQLGGIRLSLSNLKHLQG